MPIEDAQFNPLGVASNRQWMRLSDLILALQSQNPSGMDVIARLDPTILDFLRALAAHRHITAEEFVTGVVMTFAADAADAAWDIGMRQHAATGIDPEAELLGQLLLQSMRRHVRAEHLLGSEQVAADAPRYLARVGHPYGPA